jgi:hypothetical protein
MHIYDRFARIAAILLLVFALHGCGGDDSGPADSTPQTSLGLISHTWRASAAKISNAAVGDIVVPVLSGSPLGFEDVRLTFDQTTYTFTFPGGQCDIPDGVHTISGPWRFEANDTQVVLDRSSATVGETADFVWDILELTFGNLKTRYDAPFPPDCGDASFELVWVVE